MTILNSIGVAPVEKIMVENRLTLVDSVVRRVNQMEGSQTTMGRGSLTKTIRDTKTELDRNMIFEITLWHSLVRVADAT